MLSPVRALILVLAWSLCGWVRAQPVAPWITETDLPVWATGDAAFAAHPAALVGDTSTAVVLAAGDRFHVPGLQDGFVGIHRPLGPRHHLAAGIRQFGFVLYRETTLSMCYALRAHDRLDLGIALHHHILAVPGQRVRYRPSADLSLIARLTDRWQVAAIVRNASATRLTADPADRLPLALALGVTHRAHERVAVSLWTQLDDAQTWRMGAGLSYRPVQRWQADLGVHVRPWAVSMGGVLRTDRLRIHLAVLVRAGIAASPSTLVRWRVDG